MSSPADSRTQPPAPPPPKRKLPWPGAPWSEIETTHLIQAYEEKWYSLKRGQLKAQQWEEVAAAVAARCRLVAGAPEPKNGTQCRHKMEKLRKRYRTERLKPNLSRWIHFDEMDRMERGPLPISSRPPPTHPAAPRPKDGEEKGGSSGISNSSEEEEEDDDDDDDDDDDEGDEIRNREDKGGFFRGGNWGFPAFTRKRSHREVEEKQQQDDEEEEMSASMKQMVSVVRRFGEGLLRIEKRRLEMMRELERDWMEMEAKRAEMVFEYERCIVDMVGRSFRSAKKAKKKAAAAAAANK